MCDSPKVTISKEKRLVTIEKKVKFLNFKLTLQEAILIATVIGRTIEPSRASNSIYEALDDELYRLGFSIHRDRSNIVGGQIKTSEEFNNLLKNYKDF